MQLLQAFQAFTAQTPAVPTVTTVTGSPFKSSRKCASVRKPVHSGLGFPTPGPAGTPCSGVSVLPSVFASSAGSFSSGNHTSESDDYSSLSSVSSFSAYSSSLCLPPRSTTPTPWTKFGSNVAMVIPSQRHSSNSTRRYPASTRPVFLCSPLRSV